MIHTARIKSVATFEFLCMVKRPGYLIMTFGMPVFMTIYGGIVALPAYYATQKEKETSVYGLVDQSGVVKLEGDARPTIERLPPELQRAIDAAGQRSAMARAIAEDPFVFRPFADEASARRALLGHAVRGYFVVPADYLASGRIDHYQPDAGSISASSARDALSALLRERVVAGRLDGNVAARVLQPIERTRRFAITRDGRVTDGGSAASAVRLVVPLAFMVLFLMSVVMTSGYLIQGTATEKENKVVEVLLASANPDEILAGKLIGLGGAGFLQIVVWFAILTAGGIGVVPLFLSASVEFPWPSLALALPLFVLGFLFYGSIMMGTGSLGSNMREAQQIAMIWSLTAALPLIMMGLLIRDPHGIAARIMTYLPFTAAPVIMLRASLDVAYLRWWEGALAFVSLGVSCWIAIRMGARLFRIGLITSGSRPSLREVIRQARLAA